MKKLFIVNCSLLIVFALISYQLSIINLTQAADSTPSASVSSSSIKDKIDALKKEIASKAAAFKATITKKLTNKIITGIVVEKQADKLILQNPSTRTTRTVIINEFTTYQKGVKSAKNSSITLKNIDPEDFIVAMGDVDDKNILTTKKVVWLPDYKPTTLQSIWGQITSVSSNSISVKTKDNQNLSLLISDKTIFKWGNNEGSLAQAKVQNLLVSIGEEAIEGRIKPRFIYLYPTASSSPSSPASSKTSTPSSSKR
ncbi:hypothetical protein HYS93_02070 [Candidatus Daviesbacteria bacterium]|nr:hypothetical protein [Candidatus Daviesbacteria bacterium]